MQTGNFDPVALINEPGTQRLKGFALLKMNSHSQVQMVIRIFNGYTFPGVDIAIASKTVGHADIPTRAHYERQSEEANKKLPELLHVPYKPKG